MLRVGDSAQVRNTASEAASGLSSIRGSGEAWSVVAKHWVRLALALVSLALQQLALLVLAHLLAPLLDYASHR
jgi:hypothetical protein